MQIDWNHFRPPAGLAGGAASGLAAGLPVLAMLAGMLLHDNVWLRRRRKVAPA